MPRPRPRLPPVTSATGPSCMVVSSRRARMIRRSLSPGVLLAARGGGRGPWGPAPSRLLDLPRRVLGQHVQLRVVAQVVGQPLAVVEDDFQPLVALGFGERQLVLAGAAPVEEQHLLLAEIDLR